MIFLTLIRETPIFDIRGAARGTLPRVLFFYDAEYICKNHNNIPAVHPMTLEQFNLIRGGIDAKKLEYVKLWSEQFEAEEIDVFHVYKYEPWITQPLTHSATEEAKDENGFGFRGIDPVVVDLNFPDKILIESFKQYLSARRTESKTEQLSKPFRQQDFYDWVRFGILPYLDLKLWEIENGNKIPLRVIADAIYPMGEGGEETVRKTTVPLANSLIHNNNLRLLIAQVAVELVNKGVSF